MISHQEALELVLSQKKKKAHEFLPLASSLGYFLAEEIVADRDFPPFDRVAMDGIAVHSKNLANGFNRLKIEASIAAGAVYIDEFNPQHCVEIMTGAVLPNTYDRVIPYELIRIDAGFAEFEWNEELKPKSNIHFKGTDRKKDDVLCREGERIDMGRMAVLATVGKDTVKVISPLKIAVISTGNELVEIYEKPNDFQIRRSNSIMIKADLQHHGHRVDDFHLKDDYALLRTEIQSLMRKYDVLIFSGGVSMGKYDYLPEVFKDLGVKKFFHKVAQRPGKPFWFGRREECVFFGLPGNPVSSFVCYKVYIKAWIDSYFGKHVVIHHGFLAEDLVFKPNLHLLKASSLYEKDGHTWIKPRPQSGSGDLSSLMDVDAVLSVDKDIDLLKKGTLVQYYKI